MELGIDDGKTVLDGEDVVLGARLGKALVATGSHTTKVVSISLNLGLYSDIGLSMEITLNSALSAPVLLLINKCFTGDHDVKVQDP